MKVSQRYKYGKNINKQMLKYYIQQQIKLQSSDQIRAQTLLNYIIYQQYSMNQNQINGYEMDANAFYDRFSFVDGIQDPFARDYEIAKDNKKQIRAIYKQYLSQTQDQQQAILGNLENYHKLSQTEGIAKFLAYTKTDNEIIAAFEYNDMTITEYSQTDQFKKERTGLYVLLLSQITQILKKMNQIDFDIDQLCYQNILIYQQRINNHSRKRIKLMYDERQKIYEKIVEGIKSFQSKEKLEAAINNLEQFNSLEGQETIYQLGLILVDLMFQCQMKNLNQNQNQIFARDQPIVRSRLSNNLHQSYYTFIDGQVQRKEQIISDKVKFLLNHKDRNILQLTQLAIKMIEPLNSRLTLQQLQGESDRIQKIYNDSKKKVARIITNQNQTSLSKNNFSKSQFQVLNQCENIKSYQNLQQKQKNQDVSSKIINVQQSNHISSQQVLKKQQMFPMTINKISQTQIQREFIKKNQAINSKKQISPTNIPSSGLTNIFSNQNNLQNIKVIIPKQSILQNVKAHQSVKNCLENLLKKLQQSEGIHKKVYFDNSTYYGEINENNNKRNGEGVYIYTSGQTSGDIYFGSWKDNILTAGTYLFKNGQSYEGTVKNGKQGWGKYRYNNGNVYQGEWRDDIKNGKGTMNYPNGDRYQGTWKNGKKNGQGKYFYNNGTIYEGSFANGKKSGFGTIFFVNGTRIQANWQLTHIEGNGTVHYPNGDYFQGNYHMSEKHGKGLYVWAGQNCKYQGDFRKDLLQGQAKLYFSDRQFYSGKIKNGKRNGQGRYNYQNGDKFQGQWKDDFKSIGCYKFQNGDQFQGRFKENQLNFGVMRYSNGQKYEGQFKDGYRNGVGSYHSSTGIVLYQGHWKNDNFVQQ